MKNFKGGVKFEQKGITLIALIITIIVMVILAGIIIVSAVMDGGIIDRAQAAMKEHERGEVEDLIIASYKYGKTASTSTQYAYLDLVETGKAIFENLTANGFELPGGTPTPKDDGNGNEILDVTVKGDHGEYDAEIDKNGLVGGVTLKGDNDFEITIEQIYDASTNSAVVKLIPTGIFTEDEAAEKVAKIQLGDETIKDLKGLIKLFLEQTYLKGDDSEGTANKFESYEAAIAYVQTMLEGAELPEEEKAQMEEALKTPQGVFRIIMIQQDMEEYETIEQLAEDFYQFESKILRVNGKEVENAIWEGNIVTCKIADNGTFTVELELDEKKASKNIEVTKIGRKTFELDVTQVTTGEIVTLEIIPKDFFTEDEAVLCYLEIAKELMRS